MCVADVCSRCVQQVCAAEACSREVYERMIQVNEKCQERSAEHNSVVQFSAVQSITV